MKLKDYEINIISSSSDVKEIELENGTKAFTAVSGEKYAIRIYNNNSDYRIWATLHIDGIPVMKEGWGLIAKTDGYLTWEGYEIDDHTEREFMFVDKETKTAAFEKGVKAEFGVMEIKIVRESIKWDILSPPPPMILAFMGTGMGNKRNSNTTEAKIKFNWGEKADIIKIPYGTIQDLNEKHKV
jgi:hypothetical protein